MKSSFLDAARRAGAELFVGRARERAALHEALVEAAEEPRIVFCLGPGGIGKSSLLEQFAGEARAGGHEVAWTAAEHRGLHPDSLSVDPETLGRGERPDLLVVDGLERSSELGRWLFEDGLARAGPRLMLAIGSRDRPSDRLKASLPLTAISRELVLEPLTPTEASALLERRGVPTERCEEMLALADGLPLSLALLAERERARPGEPLTAAQVEDVVITTARELTSHAPSEVHRLALYAAAVAAHLDAELLAALLDREETQAVFDWLVGLTFVEREGGGVSLHPKVRSALARDLGLREPALRRTLLERFGDALIARVEKTPVATRHLLTLEGIRAAQRSEQTLLPVDDERFDRVRASRLRSATMDDLEPALGIVRRHEGPASARALELAIEAGAAALWMLDDGEPEPMALFGCVLGPAIGDSLADADPVLAAARERQRRWCGPGESLAVIRWWMTREGYQSHSAEMSAVVMAGPHVSEAAVPEARYLLFWVVDPPRWEPLAPVFGLTATDGAPAIEGRPSRFYAVDLHAAIGDLRGDARARVAVAMHLKGALATLEGLAVPPPPTGGEVREPVDAEVVEAALRAALGSLHRPLELRRSPLTDLVLVRRRAEPPEIALAALLRDTCRAVGEEEGYEDAARMLEVTYLQDTGKQQAAALALGLPYGTYRYQLRRAIGIAATRIVRDEREARVVGGGGR